MLSKIWLPDTYVANDRRAYFHKATVLNKYIRITSEGHVQYSIRYLKNLYIYKLKYSNLYL